MKKNIFLGLMLLSATPAFSADAALETGVAAESRGIRAILWSWVPAQRYVTHQTVYGVAGGGAAYTAAHCAGASDGWLGWIGLGGLCGGVWLGNRQYRSLERKTGQIEGERDAARALAAQRQATITARDTSIRELQTTNGQLIGERNAARIEVEQARARLETESVRHAAAEAESAKRTQELNRTVAQGLQKVQEDLGVNRAGLGVLVKTQLAALNAHRSASLAAAKTLEGNTDEVERARKAACEIDSILPSLRGLQNEIVEGKLLAPHQGQYALPGVDGIDAPAQSKQ